VTVLLGHPTGNPNVHQAALAHLAAGHLEAFCVPWMPSASSLAAVERIRPLRSFARRAGRRSFAELEIAPKIQGRAGELRRLLKRAIGRADEDVSQSANAWVMRTMARHCRRAAVTAVHAYEDCALTTFVEARRRKKACVYDMPIGYHEAWAPIRDGLIQRFGDWMPGRVPPNYQCYRDQKTREMELADLVIAPSDVVRETITRYHPRKAIAIAPYGVNLQAWPFAPRYPKDECTFLFVGNCSLRKGVPLLLEAWRAADLRKAHLQLVGSWQLAESKLRDLPGSVRWSGAVSPVELQRHYAAADVFILPTYFEGRALVVGEAMSSGLPVVTTPASGADDVVDDACGRMIPVGDLDALVESLRWCNAIRDVLPALGRRARVRAEACTWQRYRQYLTAAISAYV
jgi:glycosyltransferase involved in cell wall biosynthesis